MRVRAIVGMPSSGKTMLAEHIVRDLRARDVRAAYVRETAHGQDLHGPKADIARLAAAGAHPCLLVEPDGRVHGVDGNGNGNGNGNGTSAIMSALVSGLEADILLIEGADAAGRPGIRVTAPGSNGRDQDDPTALCEIERGDDGFGQDDLDRAHAAVVAALPGPADPAVSVLADGRPIPLKGYAARAVAATVAGICSTLTGLGDPALLEVRIDLRSGDHAA